MKREPTALKESDDVTIDVTTTPHNKSTQAIKNSACLCISGGNTFYLLQELKRNGLLDLINRIQDGILYIGESAGAILLAQISHAIVMDDKTAFATQSSFFQLLLQAWDMQTIMSSPH